MRCYNIHKKRQEGNLASRAIKGRHNVKKKNGKAVVLAVIALISAFILSCFLGVSALANSWFEDLPDYSNPDAFNAKATSVVYASDGTTVLAEFQLENREPVEFDQISEYVTKGTVATEDERFYDHSGVDMYGTTRALVNNILGRSLEGGSTITQQLVRNTVLSEEMTEISFKRKLREMYIALKMEEQYEKDEILLMYLNTINYGSGAYGIEAASERYFSKHANELTLSEAATLVGIPQSPTYNNPIDNYSNCLARRNVVLDRMVSNNVITQAEADAAKLEEIVLNPTENSMTGIKQYPYFTSYVRNQLQNQSGKYAFSTAELFSGGLEIITTLDVEDQVAAEEAAAKKAAQAGEDFEVALAAIDPDNGYIKAMVGGANDEYDVNQINMATGEGSSKRQSGSSFKTFTLVAALEAGVDPQTLIDAGYKVEVPGSTEVHNINNIDYGIRSIASAFEVSSNTAFMRLIMSVGVDKVVDVAHRMGITSHLDNVAGITLGISSVSPLEMADAYATIANGGTHYDPECIIKITDRNGEVIVDNSNPEGERAISEEVACAAIEVMKGVVTRGTGTEARLASGQASAGKTGTTETGQDSWFVGITPQMSVGIWLGERTENYTEAKPVSITTTSVFADFMNKVLEGEPIEQFKTAAAPTYQANYIDDKNHIGKGSWYTAASKSSSSSSSSSSAAKNSSSKSNNSSKSSSAAKSSKSNTANTNNGTTKKQNQT